jgi:hypothetical protein
MLRYFSNLLRLWRKSPSYPFVHLGRKASESAKKILPVDDWANWLGEEMRPFNSAPQNNNANTVEKTKSLS